MERNFEDCKSFMELGMNIVILYKTLVFDEKEFVLSKRLLKAGTAAGTSSYCGNFRKAWRKAVETKFWLELLKSFYELKTDRIYHNEKVKKQIDQVNVQLSEIIQMLEEK